MVLITFVDYLSWRIHLFTLAELLHGLVCYKPLKSLFLYRLTPLHNCIIVYYMRY